MVYSTATHRGKLGTAVWWRPGANDNVQLIDYDNSGHRITAVALRWNKVCFTYVSAHAPTRGDTLEAHNNFIAALGRIFGRFHHLGEIFLAIDTNKDVGTIANALRRRCAQGQTEGSGTPTHEFVAWLLSQRMFLPPSLALTGTWWHPARRRWLHLDGIFGPWGTVRDARVETAWQHPLRSHVDHRPVAATISLRTAAGDSHERRKFFASLQNAKTDRQKMKDPECVRVFAEKTGNLEILEKARG